jgi:spore germination protein PC
MKELHNFIEYQAKRLQRLEETVNSLQKEIVILKEKPPVQVGNIEYKFDQLKVETLEGTLNIGINPSDLEGVSDFSVDNQNIKVQPSPKNYFRESMDIENEIREFLESSLPAIYEETKEKLNFTVDDSYYQFIKDDILKQLPKRIQIHLSSLTPEDRAMEDQSLQGIIEKIKAEIHQGVYLFLNQLQKQEEDEKE